MVNTTIGAVIGQIVIWYVPIVICYFAWPILCRRREYVVAAAVLLLTPVFVDYGFLEHWPSYYPYADWLRPIAPMAVSLPQIINQFPGSATILVFMALPLSAFVGLFAWLLVRRYVIPGASSEAPEAAGDSPVFRRSANTRHRALRSPLAPLKIMLRKLGDLALLLVATTAYIQLWFVPLNGFAQQ